MKKILTIFIFTILLASCQENKQAATNKKIQEKSPNESLIFRIDKKLETLYFVFLLADYPLISQQESAYKTEALSYFEKYRTHPAVEMAKQLIDKGFVADYAVNWLFQYSEFPEFKKNRTVNFPFELRPIDAESLGVFRESLISFYVQAHSGAFLAKKQPFLADMTKAVKDKFTTINIMQTIENYFGEKKKADYYVILSPLLHSGGFSVECPSEKEMFALIGPNRVQDLLPKFDHEFLEQDLIIHEFSHNYTNPIVLQFMKETKQFEQTLFPSVKEKVKQEGYETWESFMIELIVRATTVRIVENIYEEDASEKLLDYERSVGFAYVKDISEMLRDYEASRDKYPALIDYFPEIIKGFDSIRMLPEVEN